MRIPVPQVTLLLDDCPSEKIMLMLEVLNLCSGALFLIFLFNSAT